MKLNYQSTGSGEPLIILHGLFGTLENWGSQIKALSEEFTVIAADLRNHGRSPHSDEISYDLMANDVLELMDDLNLTSAHLMGHSMGGKVAMQLALDHPDRIKKLIIVDIAPVHYPRHHDDVLKGLFSIELSDLKSRSEADKQLSTYIEDMGIRAFLLKNLYRNDDKQFAWRMNLNALANHYDRISEAPASSRNTSFASSTLFIKGADSNYITTQYQSAIMSLFPEARFKIIQGAGHWPHAEKATIFTRIVLGYLKETK